MNLITPCLFCGGDARAPDHARRCDGRQGRVEAAFAFDGDPFDPVEHARTTDPDTSKAAACEVQDATEVQLRVIALHRQHPSGLTDEELVALYAREYPQPRSLESQASPRKRRSDLARAGVLADSGDRRPLASGRHGIVWKLDPRR